MQTDAPLHRDEEAVGSVTSADGLEWSVFQDDDRDGELVHGIATDRGLNYAVSVESLWPDLGDPTPLDVLLETLTHISVES